MAGGSVKKVSALAAKIAFLLSVQPACILNSIAFAQDIVVTELRIPTRGSGKKGLEAVMVRPSDSSPHPLALLTHGTPRVGSDRQDMTPLAMIPQAREFARRGWTAVIVMRRGFGDSGGGYDEEAQACGRRPDFVGPTQAAAKDLRESVEYLRTRPEVDPSRMIGVGVSAGGMAMVGMSADPPPGMVAAISFAGGRGSDSPDHVCNEGALVSAFAEFGRHSKIPMLWVYAANDHYFRMQLAQSFYQAYNQSGGKATFFAAGPFGEDGHMLFSLRGIPTWTPMVDEFLKRQNLVLRETLLQIPVPSVDPPAYLLSQNREEFELYLLGAPHKAFAASQGGHAGMIFGRRTDEEAEKRALEGCKKVAPKDDPCTVVMINDKKAQE
jgi:dienelactone hydrolase